VPATITGSIRFTWQGYVHGDEDVQGDGYGSAFERMLTMGASIAFPPSAALESLG
jgi:hypothetical protein